jgi:hypothetical protein
MSVVQVAHGYLTTSDRADVRRFLLTEDAPERVAGALDAAATFYRGAAFEVRVDDRARGERVEAELLSAGWEPVQDTVVLALIGSVRASPGPDALAIEDVEDPKGLREWATVKIQGFADDERSPTPQDLQRELSAREAEWPLCRYQLARLEGRAVGILGHYTGMDQMVFNLATRVPLRHRGIAQAMLAHWTLQAVAPGQDVRSLLINCDDGGPAAALYERLGFTDEVYWHRRYRHRGLP